MVFCALLLAGRAFAQDGQPAAGSQGGAQTAQQGPLVLEPVHSGFVVTPDAKVTRLNGATKTLVGAYGGWLMEDKLLLGGGGYWLANDSRDFGMGYGGFVIGWAVPATQRIRFGVRGLVGGGQARTRRDLTFTVPDFDHHDFPPGGNVPTTTFTQRVRFDQGFFIAEPQAEVVVRVSRWLAIDAAAGYRAIAAAHGLDSQLRGPVGSLGLQFGGGS